VADVNGDGQLELVVLLVDNPPQQNQGFNQLGRGLGADGTVTGWTGWLGIPGWHSWYNQGADPATARLEGRRPGSAAADEASTNCDVSARRVRGHLWYRHGGSP
jgi:hypothetical protein